MLTQFIDPYFQAYVNNRVPQWCAWCLALTITFFYTYIYIYYALNVLFYKEITFHKNEDFNHPNYHKLVSRDLLETGPKVNLNFDHALVKNSWVSLAEFE